MPVDFDPHSYFISVRIAFLELNAVIKSNQILFITLAAEGGWPIFVTQSDKSICRMFTSNIFRLVAMGG